MKNSRFPHNETACLFSGARLLVLAALALTPDWSNPALAQGDVFPPSQQSPGLVVNVPNLPGTSILTTPSFLPGNLADILLNPADNGNQTPSNPDTQPTSTGSDNNQPPITTVTTGFGNGTPPTGPGSDSQTPGGPSNQPPPDPTDIPPPSDPGNNQTPSDSGNNPPPVEPGGNQNPSDPGTNNTPPTNPGINEPPPPSDNNPQTPTSEKTPAPPENVPPSPSNNTPPPPAEPTDNRPPAEPTQPEDNAPPPSGPPPAPSEPPGERPAPTNPLPTDHLNQTQKSMAAVLFEACTRDDPQLGRGFQDRCTKLLGTASDGDPQEIQSALRQISPEQVTAYGIQATRTMAGNINVVSTTILGRLRMLHTGLDTLRFAGIQFYQNGQPLRGGNAGSDAFGKLGIWINGNYHLGNVDTTTKVKGFEYDNWSITAGIDYQVLEPLVLGTAFTYITADTDFHGDAGELDTDSYIGSVYASFYPVDNLYIDVLGTYGHNNFNLTRNIQYRLRSSGDPNNADVVNAHAKGDTNGRQWALTLSTGYEFHWRALNFTPYARFNYLRYEVDDYREHGGAGWAMRFEDQDIESMKSIVGGRIAYAISLPWGILVPQARGEWHHEFRDPSRTIKASFVGDPAGQRFSIFFPHPDRDHAIFGGSITATFAHGISAFVGYEALVGYDRISSHRITLGARIQF